MASDEREALIDLIGQHDYAGNGKCICGDAIGTSDGLVWTTDPDGHLANVLMREGWHRGE